VSHETDFIDLYAELELDPDCDLDQFRQAYRRRVAALHPDRQTRNPPDPQAAGKLQSLTVLYRAAMTFHRQHGRLPGATSPAAQPAPHARTTAIRSRPTRPASSEAPRRSRLWLVVLIAIVAGVILWDRPSKPEAPSTDSDTSVRKTSGYTGKQVETDNSSGVPLHLGMSLRQVRKIQGDPFMVSGNRWDYGPSWIRFENGKVAGWYSSPLRPLKDAVSEPDLVHP
jgi:hypothetical protein